MPYADSYEEHGRLTRTLIYGKDKTKKTWWACKAAQAGYNVILLDGDDGSSIVRQLPMEARKKILVINCVDTAERSVFARFMASFLRPNVDMLWDEQEKKSVIQSQINSMHSYAHIKPSLLTANDVVIVDSWTALAASTAMEWATETETSLIDIKRMEDNFALPNYQARFMDWALNKLHTLPCHLIVVGHETVYEKYEDKDVGGGKKKRVMVSSEIIPISSTGPQGKKLGKHFNDILYFKMMSVLGYRIDTRPEKDKTVGSRLLAPKEYNWDEITPQILFDAVGSKPTGEPCRGAVFIPKGKEVLNGSLSGLSEQEHSKEQQEPPTNQSPAVLTTEGKTSKISLLSKLKS